MDPKKQIPVDIIIVVILVLLTTILILGPGDLWVRTVLGLAMVLFIPGYALVSALFPGKDDLEGIERAALPFALSIAVVPLLGLALNYSPWGIRLVPMLITLDVFTLGLCGVAVIRRKSMPSNKVFSISFSEMYQFLEREIFTGSGVERALNVLLVISILTSMGMLVHLMVIPKQGEKFTEFYILGPNGSAKGYPNQISLNNSSTVIVGVVNNEYEVMNYSVQLLLDNEPIVVREAVRGIVLDHDQVWEMPLTITPQKVGTDMKLQFNLFKEPDKEDPYRNLFLWINVSEGPDGA